MILLHERQKRRSSCAYGGYAVRCRFDAKTQRLGRSVCGDTFTASLLSSSYLLFFKDRIFLGASLLTKDPAKFVRPRTGARVQDILRTAAFELPLFVQYAGGKGTGSGR